MFSHTYTRTCTAYIQVHVHVRTCFLHVLELRWIFPHYSKHMYMYVKTRLGSNHQLQEQYTLTYARMYKNVHIYTSSVPFIQAMYM